MSNTEAFQVLGRIRNGETFESKYTKLPITDFSVMSVNDDELFNDLTQEERLQIASTKDTTVIPRPILYIWTNTYVYISELNIWKLIESVNTVDASQSYYPEFIAFDKCGMHYIFEISTGILCSSVQNTVNG